MSIDWVERVGDSDVLSELMEREVNRGTHPFDPGTLPVICHFFWEVLLLAQVTDVIHQMGWDRLDRSIVTGGGWFVIIA